MATKIEREEVPNNITIIKVVGRITCGESATDFEDAIKKEVKSAQQDGRPPYLLLNLEEVFDMNDSAIGTLINGKVEVSKTNGQLKLILSRAVENILKITHLYSVFSVYKDKATAIQDFNNKPCGPAEEFVPAGL